MGLKKWRIFLINKGILSPDLLLELEIFSPQDKNLLPKTRYLQAYVKYLKIKKLAEAREYKDRLGNSGRIRDWIKDCLNDMTMALETKFGKRFQNRSWEPWMNELAEIRNHASHVMTAFHMVLKNGDTRYFLRAISSKGKITTINKEALPYLKETLQKIKEKLEIIEI
jgi:hypothetical protein